MKTYEDILEKLISGVLKTPSTIFWSLQGSKL